MKALEKSESKHSVSILGPIGYQYQRGLSNSLEAGLDITYTMLGPGIGTNLRYHVVQRDSALHSIQLGISTEGAKANYMFTRTLLDAKHFRIGPHISYRKEAMRNGIAQGFTSRLGASATYGFNNKWLQLGYSIPLKKGYEYDDTEPGGFWGSNPRTGDSQYNLEIKVGFSF